MPKFRINKRFLVYLIFFIVAFHAGLNVFLASLKNKIADDISASLTHKITIKNAFFIFPNHLLIQDLTATPKNRSGSEQDISVSLAGVKISLWDLIVQRRVTASTIALNNIYSSDSALMEFFNGNANYLTLFFSNLPKADVNFIIKEAQVRFVRGSEIDLLNINFGFRIQGDNFAGHGNFFTPNDLSPLLFNLEGLWTPHGIKLDQFDFQKPNFHSNLWGEIKDNILQLKGYAFLGKTKIPAAGFIRSVFPNAIFTKSKGVAEPIVEVTDADIRIQLDFPLLKIDRLNFVLNNFPIASKGTVLLTAPPKLELAVSLLNAPSGRNRIRNFKQANLLINGAFKKNVFVSKASLNFLFEQAQDASFPLDRIDITTSNLLVYYDAYRRQTVQLDKGAISLKTTRAQHIFSFDDLKMSANLKADKFKIVDIVGAMYGGHLQGRVWIDPTNFPVRITAKANLKEINAHSLAEMLVYFSKVHGTLSGKLVLKSHPQFDLGGEFLVQDGSLQNFDFFKWMAETFSMPSLVNVPFSETLARFWLNAQGNGLTDIQLNGNDVTVNGDFNIDKNSLVSSKLSLGLSRTVLQESPKFRAIIKMFEEDIPSLIFDFQLSGHQDAMNFQWLQSEFKQRIQSRIPNFIERMIDRKIDAILEGKPTEEPAGSSP